VPEEIVTGRDITTRPRLEEEPVTHQRREVPGLQPTPGSVYLTLLTSMFMHGGWAHILGNMLFLWIFGDNIEDRLGHLRYLVFYLVCGLIASLAQVFTTVAFSTSASGLLVPSLGASGAISGVLGGYVLLFPRRQVHVIMFRFLTTVPAYVALGLWFLFQFLSGIGLLGGEAQGGGGVAYAAHIGGFIAGLALVKIFAVGRSAPAPQWKNY
jgi:membrane associated rhomboid family serine protease